MQKNVFKVAVAGFAMFSIMMVTQACKVASPAFSSQLNFSQFSETGLIVGSVSFPETKPKSNMYFPLIKSLDSDEKEAKKNSGEFIISPEQIVRLKHKGQLEDGKTYLFAIPRKPGQYDLSQVRYANMGFTGTSRTNFSGGFSIPFEVKKGEIVYIGDLFIDEYASKNDTMIYLKDNFERDIQGLRVLKPPFDWGNAQKGPIKIYYNEKSKN